MVITGMAHSGVCVPDCEAAVAFYRDVLGLSVLSPPHVMAGDEIRDDMGQLVSDPTIKRPSSDLTTTAIESSR
jgi:catechol 2,3-dioxygenase-like lactoylglutathione lyase family enzyme